MMRNLSCERVDSDDLSGELNLSDCEDNVKSRSAVKKEKNVKRQKKGKKLEANKYELEVDTNVFEINFNCLNQEAELATGDPELCKQCKAVFNKGSRTAQVNGKQVWTCEFCNNANEVCLEEEEIPKSESIFYLVEAAAQVEDKKMAGQDISVIFCLDISGSMCVSQEIHGKFDIKGDKAKER